MNLIVSFVRREGGLSSRMSGLFVENVVFLVECQFCKKRRWTLNLIVSFVRREGGLSS